MKKYVLIVLILSLFKSGLAAADGGLQPSASIRCLATSENSDVTEFDFDLYMTGFPMGGVLAYSGFFEAKTPGLACHTTRGPLRTIAVDIHQNTITYSATSDCLRDYSYKLQVNTDFYKKNESYNALLEYQSTGPLGSGTVTEVSMRCQLSQ